MRPVSKPTPITCTLDNLQKGKHSGCSILKVSYWPGKYRTGQTKLTRKQEKEKDTNYLLKPHGLPFAGATGRLQATREHCDCGIGLGTNIALPTSHGQ